MIPPGFLFALPRLHWPRRRILLVGGLGLAVTIATAVALPVALGRTSPPARLALETERALVEARIAGSARWAAAELVEAEQRIQTARAEYRRQELRLLPLRNFAKAREDFGLAANSAKRAAAAAVDNAQFARASAEIAVETAAAEVSRIETLTAELRLQHDESRLMRGARLRVVEARVYLAEARYEDARSAAERAGSGARLSVQRIGGRASRYTEREHLKKWRRWQNETIDWSRQHRAAAIVVNKDANTLTLYVAGREVRTYPADMGQNQSDTKIRSGDRATPEGRYRITAKKDRGRSTYYRALALNYPNDEDRKRFAEAVRKGLVSRRASQGGLIEIHGEGGRGDDWTRGCVALSNRNIDDLWPRVDVGTPVTIIGADGRHGRMSSIAKMLERGAAGRNGG